jgi:hypothetical protein
MGREGGNPVRDQEPHPGIGLVRIFKLGLTISLLVICIFVAVDFIKALIRIGRKQLAK